MAAPVSPVSGCPERDLNSPTTDVTWLLHRAAQLMRHDLDAGARECGLNDQRDWLVLSIMADGRKRTQLAIGQRLGLDKTTLTAILDRLEREALVVRVVDPADRRARLPELTESGRAMVRKIALLRDKVESCKLSAYSPEQLDGFYAVLNGLARVDSEQPDSAAHGSCM